MKINELLIVKGLNILETSPIISKEKGIYTLQNGIKFSVDERLNIKVLNSKCSLEEYSEERFELLKAKKDMPRLLRTLNQVESLEDESYIRLYKKLSKTISKYFEL